MLACFRGRESAVSQRWCPEAYPEVRPRYHEECGFLEPETLNIGYLDPLGEWPGRCFEDVSQGRLCLFPSWCSKLEGNLVIENVSVYRVYIYICICIEIIHTGVFLCIYIHMYIYA